VRRSRDAPRIPRASRRMAALDSDLAQLRRRAELQAEASELQQLDTGWPAEARRVLHELRVHQIELEMQNEELRTTREQLEASKARYFDLYDLAPVGYFTLSEEGRILEASLTAAPLLGVARSALSRQPFSRFIVRDDQDIYYLLFRTLFETGEPQTCELRMTKKDGAPFWAWLDAVVALDERGTPGRRIVISDMTERKRGEQNLCKSEERLRYAERLAHVGNWKWDIESTQLTWSDEEFQVFSQPSSSYTPSYEGFFQQVVSQERERVARELSDALVEKRGFSSEVQIIRPDVEVRTIRFVAELQLNEKDMPVGMFGATQHITDIKKHEAQLLQSQKDLRALTARLVDLQESGMRELARELHDDLRQQLAILGIEIFNSASSFCQTVANALQTCPDAVLAGRKIGG